VLNIYITSEDILVQFFFRNFLIFLLGQYIFDVVKEAEDLQICFIWNRTPEKLQSVPKELILDNLEEFSSKYVMKILYCILIESPNVTGQSVL